jgi:hypothetical protein
MYRTFVALAFLFAILAVSTTSADAQMACSEHLTSCDAGCARSRNPNHWSCVGSNSCAARYRRCMKTGTWTSLVNNPGTRPALRR